MRSHLYFYLNKVVMMEEKPQNRTRRTDDRDPTSNVMMLVDLTTKGLKEFVIAQIERIDEKHSNHQKHDKEMAEEKNKRTDADIRHCLDLMAEGFKNMEKNREGDIRNVAVASQKSTEVADTLAKSVTVTADTMNTRMVASAEALARNLETRMEQVNTKIDQSVTLISGKVSNLEMSQGQSTAKSGMTTSVIAMLAGLAGTVIAGIIIGLIKFAQSVLK